MADDKQEIIAESADLLYHLTVLLAIIRDFGLIQSHVFYKFLNFFHPRTSRASICVNKTNVWYGVYINNNFRMVIIQKGIHLFQRVEKINKSKVKNNYYLDP